MFWDDRRWFDPETNLEGKKFPELNLERRELLSQEQPL
jgi:hypothetical protein